MEIPISKIPLPSSKILESPIEFKMNDEVELQPQCICDVYSHLMRLARINIMNSNCSQPILGQNNPAAFHAIFKAMNQPPSDLHLFQI